MKYIVRKGTNTFDRLTEIGERVKAIQTLNRVIVDELDGNYYISCSGGLIAGPLEGIELKQKPEGWKQVYANVAQNMFFPKSVKQNKELLTRIATIPVVKRSEVNEIVGFKNQIVGRRYIQTIGLIWGQDFHLVGIDDEVDYTPLADMDEILTSEYKRLKDELNANVEEEVSDDN